MNRLTTTLATLLLILFPGLVLAENSLNFAPPASDYSMIFLGNLFGIVDGVLSGTGSQIMGSMFSVFNAAVLALGGIIIMYTLLVSTMNTAHEGQMLGQKWSSIWIPIRSTVGLALLIPKASGYCLMQIFVMWVVVQGVGAADKVWSAALSYLNRGGVIIQAQKINPAAELTTASANGMGGVATGAFTILAGQVCMLGIQSQLNNQRTTYLNLKSNDTGPCLNPTPGSDMDNFCKTAVPDFLASVNAVTTQSNAPTQASWTLLMPNFDSAPYNALNGICGNIQWNNINGINTTGNSLPNQISTGTSQTGATNTLYGLEKDAAGNYKTDADGNYIKGDAGAVLTPDELSAAQMSRAIAIQQMYVDLAAVTQAIIGNSPAMAQTNEINSVGTTTPYIQGIANQQFGVPYNMNSTVCTVYSNDEKTACVTWGPATGSTGGATLFSGTEFINALNDYNGVMMPTLNLIRQMGDAGSAASERAFINKASTQGWIMAGAYFFDLVNIQGSSTANASLTDSNTGLNNSQFNVNSMASAFGDNNSCTGTYAVLCTWLGGDVSKVNSILALINGKGIDSPTNTTSVTLARTPNMAPNPARTAEGGQFGTTVFGLVNNSMMLKMPDQPGLAPLTFANTINFNVDTSLYTLQHQDFTCGKVKIAFFSFCLGQMMGNLFYNVIFLFIYNTFMQIFGTIINQVIMAFLMIPLSGMADIFKQGVQVLAEPGANPIVALANMGVQYINFAGNLWLMLLNMAVTSALIPVFGVFIFALISLAMPLLLAWVGVMTTIGFTTAYYIPILPYMIFTFGAISWLISVIEAMVAAPIVALGVTHPEGHDAFGKGEAAIMILINVFLRPSMMIIGYIAAIALSYVGVWILNAGYDQAIGFIQKQNTAQATWGLADMPSGTGGYSDWAGIYAFFFSILTYTSMYLVIVQKSFTLISYLPDKVLRWIGGNPESLGQESAQWAGEVQQQQKEGIEKTQGAQGQMDKQLGGYGMKALNKAKGGLGEMGGGGKVSGEATPDDGKKDAGSKMPPAG